MECGCQAVPGSIGDFKYENTAKWKDIKYGQGRGGPISSIRDSAQRSTYGGQIGRPGRCRYFRGRREPLMWFAGELRNPSSRALLSHPPPHQFVVLLRKRRHEGLQQAVTPKQGAFAAAMFGLRPKRNADTPTIQSNCLRPTWSGGQSNDDIRARPIRVWFEANLAKKDWNRHRDVLRISPFVGGESDEGPIFSAHRSRCLAAKRLIFARQARLPHAIKDYRSDLSRKNPYRSHRCGARRKITSFNKRGWEVTSRPDPYSSRA